jgi:hypothetical protein
MWTILNTDKQQTGTGTLRGEASTMPDFVAYTVIDVQTIKLCTVNQDPRICFRGVSYSWVLRLEVDQLTAGGICDPQAARTVRDNSGR